MTFWSVPRGGGTSSGAETAHVSADRFDRYSGVRARNCNGDEGVPELSGERRLSLGGTGRPPFGPLMTASAGRAGVRPRRHVLLVDVEAVSQSRSVWPV